jgi:NAD(P)-dependent dehydrogenase (short-subunit alcohol dehydrogenase family)
MTGRLQDKVALITGSTSGIGRASAELFAQEGARVVVNGRRKELGEQVVEGIRAAGGTATFFHGDVGQSEQIQALIAHAVQTYGRLDILVNNAISGRGGGTVVQMEEADWDASMAVALKAVYLGCKYAIPEMIKGGGGAIINVSSVHGLLVARHNALYETAKAGMINLTRQVALDFGKQGIRANALCPGLIITERNKWRFDDPGNMRREQALYPIGRPGSMLEAAKAALFLASDDASFVTGHALVVDGGLTIQLQETVAYIIEEGLQERGGKW